MKIETVGGVVTGGASGLGEGVVRMLAGLGAKATIIDRPASRGDELAQELGPDVAFAPADITDSAQVESAVKQAVSSMGSVNLLVSCAGISPADRVVNKDGTPFDLEVFRQAVDVNLVGTFDVLRHCAVAMSQNEPLPSGERGVIINVSSIAATEGQVGQAAYAASKAGILGLTVPLARELARFGIRALTICPGIMDTPMLDGTSDKLRQSLIDLHVFPKRLGTAEDFAALVKAIVENEMLNGEVIRIDAATRL